MSAWKKQDEAQAAVFRSVSEETEERICQFMCSGKADDDQWDFGKFKTHNGFSCAESSQVVRDRLRQVKKMRADDPKKFVKHCLAFGLCPPLRFSAVQPSTIGHKNNIDNLKLQLNSGVWMLQHTIDRNPGDGEWQVNFSEEDSRSIEIAYLKQAPDVKDRLRMFGDTVKTQDFLFQVVEEATKNHNRGLKRDDMVEKYTMFTFDKEMCCFFVDRNGNISKEAKVFKDEDKTGRARFTMFLIEKDSWIQQVTSPQALGSPQPFGSPRAFGSPQAFGFASNLNIPRNVAFQEHGYGYAGAVSVDHDMAETDTSVTASNENTEPGTIGISPLKKPPVATLDNSDKIAIAQLSQEVANLTKLVAAAHMNQSLN
jgi:hypothetical protein